jgi:hypothetical protein
MSDPAGLSRRAMWILIRSPNHVRKLTAIPSLVTDDTPRDSGSSILVEPSPLSLARMKRLAADADLRAALGVSACAYAERKFAKQPALEQLEGVLLG